jgi:hypothetical protein
MSSHPGAHHEPAPDSPPALFASFSSGRRDLRAHHDDALADGFGLS